MKRLNVRKLNILILPALIVLSAFALRPLQKTLVQTVETLKRDYLQKGELVLNKQIRYASMGPSIFGSFDIKEIAITDFDDDPAAGTDMETAAEMSAAEPDAVTMGVAKAAPSLIPDIRIKRLSIRYSLFTLLSGAIPQAIQSVKIVCPAVDFKTEKELLEFFKDTTIVDDEEEGGGQDDTADGDADNNETDENEVGEKILLPKRVQTILAALPEGFKIRITGGTAALSAGAEARASALSVSRFFVRGLMRNKQLVVRSTLDLDAKLAGLAKKSARGKDEEKPFAISFPCIINAVYDTETGGGFAHTAFDEVVTDLFTLHNIKLKTELTNKSIVVQTLPALHGQSAAKNPADINFAYRLDDGSMSASVNFKNFAPQTMITFNNKLSRINNFILLRLSGGIEFLSDKTGLHYRTNLNGISESKSAWGEGVIKIDLSGTDHAILFNEVSLDIARGKADWRGNFDIDNLLPSGELALEAFNFTQIARSASTKNTSDAEALLAAANKPVSGVFLISSYRDAIMVFADTLSFGATDLQAFDTVIYKSSDGIDVAMQALRFNNTESFDDTVTTSHIGADLSFNNPAKGARDIQLSLTLESFALSDVLEIAGSFTQMPAMPALLQNLERNIVMTTEIFVTYDYEHFVYNIPHFITAMQGNRNNWTSASISGTDEYVSLADGNFVTDGGVVSFNANIDFANPNDVSFSSDIFWMNTTYLIQGAVLDKHNISVLSPQGLNASLNFGKDGRIAGFLLLDSLQIPIGKQALIIDASSDFHYDSPDSWEFNLDKLSFNSFSTAFLTSASAEFEARANQDGANVNRIFFDDGRGPLFGQADVRWDRIYQSESKKVLYANIVGNGALRDLNADETVSIELRRGDNSFFVWAQANKFQIGRILKNDFNFSLSGELGFFQNPNELWSCAFDLTSLNGQLGADSIDISTHGSLDEKHLELSGTAIQTDTLRTEIPQLLFDIGTSSFETAATVYGTAAGKSLYAGMEVEAHFAQINSWFNIASVVKSFSGNVSFKDVSFDTVKFDEPFNFEFSRQANIMSLNGGPQNMARAQMDSSGNFFAALSAPSPIQGTLLGLVKNNQIDARVSNLIVDISDLWNYIPVGAVDFSGGFILADIQVKGSLSDPEFFGIARANSLKLRLPQFVEGEIGPTPAVLLMNGNDMTLAPLVTRIGDGSGEISGSFRFDKWLPRDLALKIVIPDETPIPIGMNISGFLASGKAFGTINLEKNDESLRVSGAVTCNEAELTTNMGDSSDQAADKNETSAAPKSKTPVQVELTLIAGRKVEFLWPNADFPIIRANASADSTLAIQSDSNTGSFSIKGAVGIRNGELFYFQRSFYIREGSLNFDETEINFDPHLTVRAEARDRSNNEAVTISMIIEDQSIKNFTPRLESSPPLSQIEILALMGEKLAGSSSDNLAGQAFVSSTADVLAQFYVVRRVERRVRDFLHLDMFSMRTQAIQNAILLNLFQGNAAPSSANANPAIVDSPAGQAGETRVGNYFDNTTVFIGKYIGASLFIQMMASLRYDKDRLEWDGLWIEPDFSMELKAPIFDIRWDLTPQHPEALWIPDNRITISKKWTLP